MVGVAGGEDLGSCPGEIVLYDEPAQNQPVQTQN